MDFGFYWIWNGFCVYDCVGGCLLGFNFVNNYLLGVILIEYEFVKDCFFVVKKEKYEEMWKVVGYYFGSFIDLEVFILEY